jgi:hypothetical protein
MFTRHAAHLVYSPMPLLEQRIDTTVADDRSTLTFVSDSGQLFDESPEIPH